MKVENKKVTIVINEFTGDIGQEAEVTSLPQLAELTAKTAWSPYLFKREEQLKPDGKPYAIHRNKKNFKRADYFAIDIDKGMSLEDASAALESGGFGRFYVQTSRSHTPDAHRFRIVFELSDPISDPQGILGTFYKLKTHFPTMDDACKDEARFFKNSPSTYLINESGPALVPSYEIPQEISLRPTPTSILAQDTALLDTRFRLSKTTTEFINEPQEPGLRHERLVKACMNAGQQGWSEEEFRALLNYSINPWLREEKHSMTITDIFTNQRWGSTLPVTYQEDVKSLTPHLQIKWVNLWLKNAQAKSTYDGLIIIKGSPTNRADVIRDIRLHSNSMNIVLFNQNIEDVVTKFIEINREKYLQTITHKLEGKQQPEAEKELNKFLDLMCGVNKKDLDTVVLKHFMWNVKRRLKGLDTNREIMPVIQGFQGIGKSYNIREGFLKPLEDLSKQTTFKQLEDQREYRLLSDNFVLFFDEMSYAGLADIDNIKRLITETRISVRRMHTTTHDLMIKNAQFIGCTNKSLINIISDNTGMRRFYEISCRPKDSVPNLLDLYEQFKKLDYELMWRAVDVNDPPPILNYITELEAIQKSYTTKHPIDEWIEDSGDVEWSGEECATRLKDLAAALNEWSEGPRISVNKLGKHLTDNKYSGILRKERKRDGIYINLRLLKINKLKGEF